jgi:hypothetical protein
LANKLYLSLYSQFLKVYNEKTNKRIDYNIAYTMREIIKIARRLE